MKQEHMSADKVSAPQSIAAPKKRRFLGKQVPAEGDNGVFTQSWFPLCMASDIEKGMVKGFPFLGGRVIVFRGEDGEARVMSAYCAHLGADLSVGCVSGNSIQCAYHFWEFGDEGQCTRTGAGDPPPKHATLFTFPTLEKHGLIWAFNGEEPLFDIPDWPFPDKDLLTVVEAFPVSLPIDPWVACAQTPDIQHVILLHNLELLGPNPAEEGTVEWTDFSMQYDIHGIAQGADMNIRAGVFGTSIYFQTGTLDGRWFGFLTGMGLPEPGKTDAFIVMAAERGTGDEAEVQEFLRRCINHEVAIASEDIGIASTINFRVGALTKSDATLSKFLQKMRNYPRAHPSAEFIR